MEHMTLRQIRKAKEITIEEMAEFLGVHKNTYAAWEKKPSVISIENCYKLCEFFGVPYESTIFLP